jgi:uncharacterized protein (TIGR02594 family)
MGHLMKPEQGQDSPPWLEVAKGELGVAELPGARSNERIIEYFAHTRLGGNAINDSTAWCSRVRQLRDGYRGYRGTHRANARSWLDWGVKLEEPRVGAITVLWRGHPDSPQGHVGFLTAVLPNRVVLLSGNSDNRVSYKEYGIGRVLSYRWPRALELVK